MDAPKWWEQTPELKGDLKGKKYDRTKRPSSKEISEKLALATKYYADYVAKETSGDRDSEGRWIKGFLTKGTVGDKIASLSVVAQKDPICAGPAALSGLLSMARKKNRSESKAAIDALKILFTQVMIPPDRALLYFFEQPVTDPRATKLHFVHWVFEDKVKKAFQEYVEIIEGVMRDTVSTQKEFALFVAYDLLKFSKALSLSSPRLVALVVNKLGDQSRQVCGKICTWLSDLVIKYPALKMAVTEEVERFLYRRNNSLRSQYYAVVFLSSLLLRREKDKALATKLIGIYLSFFRRATCGDDADGADEQKNTAESKAANGKKEGKKKKGKKGKKKDEKKRRATPEEERQRNDAVDSRLLSAIMTGIHRAFPYADTDSTTFAEHIDMLFKIARTATFNKSVQAFQLLFNFMAANDSLSDRFYSAIYERILTPEALVTTKLPIFFNILYKSLRVDPSGARVAAIVKRLLQLCAYAQPTFATACLIIVSELVKEKPALKAMVAHHAAAGEDDEEDEEDEGEAQKMDLDETKKSEHSGAYKPLKRDPRYTNSDKTCFWELYTLCRSYHPSVAKFAEIVLSGEPIVYAGDPLMNFTLVNFLDRFAFKNPKKKFTESKKGMDEDDEDEDEAPEDDDGVDEGKMAIPGKVDRLRSSQVLPPINSEASIKRKNIPEEEKFFQQYFALKADADSVISKERAEAERAREERKRKRKAERDGFDEAEMRDFFGDEAGDELDEDDGYAGFAAALAADEKDTNVISENGEEDFFDDGFDGDEADEADEDEEEEEAIKKTLAADDDFGGYDDDDDDEDDIAGLEDDFVEDDEDDDGVVNALGDEEEEAARLPAEFADVDAFSQLLEESEENNKRREWEEKRRTDASKRKKKAPVKEAPKKKKAKK